MRVAACRDQAPEPGDAQAAERFFQAEAVHRIDLFLEPASMTELAREPKDWVRGSVRLGGALHREVGLRFKGHRSMRGWAEKPAFKLHFSRYRKQRRVLGLDEIALNNMVEDETALREQLGSRVFAALGVPAPRTAYAEVFVNRQRFGLYAVVEAVAERFLEHRFGAESGPLYEGEYGCDLYERDVFGFEHDGGKDPDRAHLRAFTRAVGGPPSAWLLGDAPVVDRDKVLGYLAASALLGDFDGYRHAHNYRIYRDPGSGRWAFIPWGFDRILERRLGPFESHGRVARRCFEDAACRVAHVRTLLDGVRRFEALELEAVVDRLDALITPVLERDPRAPHSRKRRERELDELRQFLRERPAELRAELTCWDGARELDRDGDGFGCSDCDDTNPNIHPGARELCDGVDHDCSGVPGDAPECDCAEAQVGTARFALCDVPVAWWRAKELCAARGQVLASIESRSVLRDLHAAAREERRTEWWVGLDDLEREGAFRWQDGDKPVRGLWADGEPDHYACAQHCTALRDGRSAGLRDMYCAAPNPFICRAAAAAEEVEAKPHQQAD